MAARVFPTLGDHWGDFALGADGLGDLHQNPFARSIFNHSGHYWRVLALAVLLWADCALYVNLPFAQPMCHLVGF